MGEASKTQRRVDEYARAGPGSPYALKREGVEFAAYMRGEGYAIIPVSGADQLVRTGAGGGGERARRAAPRRARGPGTPPTRPPLSPPTPQLYGCNVLNLGNSKIVSVHAGTARAIVRHPAFKGDVQVIDFGSITSMYGAVHCASQVVKRTPRRW